MRIGHWWSIATNLRGHPQYVSIGGPLSWFWYMRSHIDQFDEDCGYGKRGEHHNLLRIGGAWPRCLVYKEWTSGRRPRCFICRRDGT